MRVKTALKRNAKRPLKYHYSWNPDTVHVFSLNMTLCGVVGLCHSSETMARHRIFFFLHIVTGLLSCRLWRSLSRSIEGSFEAVDFLETFSFVKLEFAFSPTHHDGGLPEDSSTTPRISPVETMDQRITAIPINCTVFPLDPGYRTLARDNLMEEQIEWRQCRVREGKRRSHEKLRGNRVSPTSIHSYTFFFRSFLFLREKIRMSEVPVAAGTRWHSRKRNSIGKKRLFLSLLVLLYCTWNVQLTRANIPNKSILNQS